jgi:16S rRNA (adenine1518-N6/adenine1519-N6)-dimethyltransferase
MSLTSKNMNNDDTQHRPRKRFGQHFLHDQSVLDRMVDAIRPLSDDHLVEIGPGLGALTKRLLTRVKHLDAVELDRDIIPKLTADCQALELSNSSGKLSIHQADALKYDFSQLSTAPSDLRVVGNLPYNISTPLLFHLLDQGSGIKDMHFMLQKEVVDRIVAQPGTKIYGRLSIMVQCRCAVERLFTVGRGAFNPPPKVESAVIRLVPYTTPPVIIAHPKLFADIVREAFNHRRKTIRNSLRAFITEEQIKQLNIDPEIRPEQLSIQDFAHISQEIYDHLHL